MDAQEFYHKEDCLHNTKYNITPRPNWIFGEEEMVLFAEEYHKMKLKENENEYISAFAFKVAKEIENMVKERISDIEERNKLLEHRILQWSFKQKDKSFDKYFEITHSKGNI